MEINEKLVEAFPRFFPEKQQGATCDKHDHFRPAESSQDHNDKSTAVFALTTRRSLSNRKGDRTGAHTDATSLL